MEIQLRELLLTVASVWLMVAFLIHGLASLILGRSAKAGDYKVNPLNERALVALKDFIQGGFLAFLGANRVFEWHLPNEPAIFLLSIALMFGVISSATWLWMYFTDRFDERGVIVDNGTDSTTAH